MFCVSKEVHLMRLYFPFYPNCAPPYPTVLRLVWLGCYATRSLLVLESLVFKSRATRLELKDCRFEMCTQNILFSAENMIWLFIEKMQCGLHDFFISHSARKADICQILNLTDFQTGVEAYPVLASTKKSELLTNRIRYLFKTIRISNA